MFSQFHIVWLETQSEKIYGSEDWNFKPLSISYFVKNNGSLWFFDIWKAFWVTKKYFLKNNVPSLYV